MTAQNSATKSGFLRYFLYKLGTLKQHIILNSIMALFSYPALALVIYLTAGVANEYNTTPIEQKTPELFTKYNMWNNVLTIRFLGRTTILKC